MREGRRQSGKVRRPACESDQFSEDKRLVSSVRFKVKSGHPGSIIYYMGPGFLFPDLRYASKKEGRMGKSKLITVLTATFWLTNLWLSQLEATEQNPVLDEIVVTDSRIEEKKRYVSTHITTITREDLKQSPARNLGELLAEKSIGYILRYPGANTAIGIRGFKTDSHGNDLKGHVLVLINGRRAGTGNVAKMVTENIERIEILRGPGAVQYGSAGMGGVVNVITRKGTENSVSVGIGYGSFGEQKGTLGVTAKKGDFDFAGSFDYTSHDDYKTGDGAEFQNTGLDSRVHFSFNGGYTLFPNNRASIVLNGVEINAAGTPNYLSQNDLDNYTDKKNISGDLIYEGGNADGTVSWLARYFMGEDEDEWFYPTASNPTGYDNDTPDERITDQQGAQLQVSTRYKAFAFTTGLDWVDYDIEASWTPQKTTYDNWAGFLLAKAFLMDGRLVISSGVRYDLYDVEVVEPAGRTEDDDQFTPTVGLAWLAADELKLRARYAEAFVMPGADQLASDYVSFGRRVVGNPNLKPETSETWEAGLDYTPGALEASATWFSTDFSDKIEYAATGDGALSWSNLGSASISGFEGELAFDLGQQMDWPYEVKPYLGFTWLTEIEDHDTGDGLKYITKRKASYGMAVSDYDGFSARLNVAYTGKQEVEDWESGIYPTPVVTLDDFMVTDLAISKRVYQNKKVGAFTLRGEARNIFDKNYAYVKGYPMPGRSFFIGLNWAY